MKDILKFAVFYSCVVYCSTVNFNISQAIFADYDSGLRPVCGDSTQVNATLGMALRQVIDMDEPSQVVKLNVWIRLKWNDCQLTWNASEYGGVSSIIVPYKKIWVPDLTLYDSISTEFYGMSDFRPNVNSDGTVYYNFPTVIEALCPIDVTNFPFDTQMCSLIFGSWSYHGLQLDFQANGQGDLSSMKDNVEWEVPQITSERHVAYYGCCPEPYPDVTFYVFLNRKPAFYVTNIITPSIMITVLVVLGFILPVSSGEKVSLEITVMLAMSVFQLLVADNLPPSADSTPWIMILFNFILGLSGVSTIIQVVVINIYFRGEKRVPDWMMKHIITPLCLVTFVSLPNRQRIWCCTKQNQIDNEEKDTEKFELPRGDNVEIWKCFSNALDRLGLFLFSLTLIIGCGFIFNQIL